MKKKRENHVYFVPSISLTYRAAEGNPENEEGILEMKAFLEDWLYEIEL